MNTKVILSVICYIFLPLGLVVGSVLFGEADIFRLYGTLAQLLLIYVLFIKPIGVIFNFKWMTRQLAYRRQLGVASFWLSLFHAVMFVFDRGIYSIDRYMGIDNYLFYGMLAMIGILILGVTSNNRSVAFFKSKWKKIQYLAYPSLFLVLLHVSMVRGNMLWFYSLGGIYVVLKILEWKKVKVGL